MTVYCNKSFSLKVERGAFFSSRLFSGLIYYFQDKSFGDSIKEIIFLMLSGEDEYLQHYGIGRKYRKKSESYGSIFVVDYKIVEELNDEELLRYYANELIKEANIIKDKKIANFRIDEFIDDMKLYFDEAIPIALQGKFVSEGKVLNTDIEEKMLEKFKRL